MRTTILLCLAQIVISVAASAADTLLKIDVRRNLQRI